jgi:hypothetical protein
MKKIGIIVNRTRRMIAERMLNYEFPLGNNSFYGKNLSLDTGGTPIRPIVVSTWRSGSTFFGEIVSNFPYSLYYFEPLSPFGKKQVRGPPNDEEAVQYLKNLFNCNFNNMEKFIDYGRKVPWFLQLNTKLWFHCRGNTKFCFDPDFLTPFCKAFKIQTMKLVRLRMKAAEKLLRDER